MTLMLGSAPFGQRPGGSFNFELPREDVTYLERCPRRVRARRGDVTVIDTTSAFLLHRRGYLAVWLFPQDAVPADLGEPYGDGLVHVPFDALDAWFEEDEQVYGHPRDPYSRIDVIPSSRAVRVSAGGRVLAESTRAKALFETGLPTRWYLPREDVRMDELARRDTTSRCAYKGVAQYFDAAGERAIAWTYEDPSWDAERVRDHICFFNERVDLDIAGERQERPRTPWATDAWVDHEPAKSEPKQFG